MSGENELSAPKIDSTPCLDALDKRHAAILQLLQSYPEQIKLGVLQPDNETEKLLNLTRADLRRMTAEDCGEAAFILNRMATYIQLQYNQIQADIEWCQQNIDAIISRSVDKYGSQYLPYEYRRNLAIMQDDVAKKLQGIIVQAKLRLTSLSFLATQIHAQARSLENLQQTKRAQK